jgi:hypothetical protein
MVAAGRTVAGIEALTHWPEAFGFAVLACGLVALGRLCGRHRVFPASLGALAAGAVAGPVLAVWLGARLGRLEARLRPDRPRATQRPRITEQEFLPAEHGPSGAIVIRPGSAIRNRDRTLRSHFS